MAIVPPGNKQALVDEQLDAVSSGDSIVVPNVALYATVKYLPPYTVQVSNYALYATVKYLPPYTVRVSNYALYAVVQRYDQRRESVIHSLYYGKNNPLLR